MELLLHLPILRRVFLPPRTQINFTVAIDFTASNGERWQQAAPPLGPGTGRKLGHDPTD